jgi:protein-S-isoprenylcysteine O-methyltransferase Ste14
MMRDKQMAILGIVLTITSVGQIIFAFLLYDQDGIVWVRTLGWIVLAISGVFGWVPIYTFRRKGGVARGKSYMQTTALVDSGIYGIVRHPQYLAGLLMNLALALVAQHWLVVVLGAVSIITYYPSAILEEQASIKKFGEPYRLYMARVPRMNAIMGIIRQIRRHTPGG